MNIDALPGEVWMPIPGYEGCYSVSNLGRVYSHRRLLNGPAGIQAYGGVLVTPRPVTKGYLQVTLSVNGKRTYRSVHRLVLLAFVGECPEGMEACHGDGVPTNNQLANLRWDTRSNNQFDKVAHGTALRGERHNMVKLTAPQVLAIRADQRMQRFIAADFGVSRATVSDIQRGRRWAWMNGEAA